MSDPFVPTAIRKISVPADSELGRSLLECSQSGEFLCIELDDGSRHWVQPEDNLACLVELLADKEFVAGLERAGDDFVVGGGLTLSPGETPQTLAKDALASPELLDGLTAAAEDFRLARGSTMNASDRPSPGSIAP